MKKNNLYILIIVIAAAAIAAWLLNIKSNSDEIEKLARTEKRLEDLSLPTKEQNPEGIKIEGAKAIGSATTISVSNIQEEFQKCFKKETSAQSLESMKSVLLQQKDYSSPSLSEENYELVSKDNQNLVVQYIPMEENENKVRVFSINPADGLPDRIKDFPQNSGEISLRLKGALSMGSVKSKTVSTTQSSYDGSMLSIEQKDDKVIRLHLITNGFDFECKELSCQCLKKE